MELSCVVDLTPYFDAVDAKIAVNNDWLEENGFRDVDKLARRVWQGRQIDAEAAIRAQPEWATFITTTSGSEIVFPTERENGGDIYAFYTEHCSQWLRRENLEYYAMQVKYFSRFAHCRALVVRALAGLDVPEDVRFVVESAGQLTKEDLKPPYLGTIYPSTSDSPTLYFMPDGYGHYAGDVFTIRVIESAFIRGQSSTRSGIYGWELHVEKASVLSFVWFNNEWMMNEESRIGVFSEDRLISFADFDEAVEWVADNGGRIIHIGGNANV